MKELLQIVREYVARLGPAIVRGWNDFWFRPSDPTTLAMIRICAGLVLLYIHATSAGYVLDLIGPNAWVDAQAITTLRDIDAISKHAPVTNLTPEDRGSLVWNVYSIWFWVQDPMLVRVLYGVFLAAIVCFTLGFCSRTASVLVWVFYVSYIHRSHNVWFGMDTMLLMVTLYLMFGPTGATLSLDRLIQRLREARGALQSRERIGLDRHAEPSWSANAVIRMIQVHIAIIYLFSGLAKLQGATWWSGIAGYYTMMVPEYRLMDLGFIVREMSDVWIEVVTLIVSYGTLVFEISFIFLIWNRTLRPLLLAAAVLLHGGIALFMGLGGFGCIMLTGCMSFVPPESMRWFLSVIFRGPTGLRFVYDRDQPATLAAASAIKAADPFGQVTLAEVHDSAVTAPAAQAGSLLLADGSVHQGGAAFRKLFRALRVLWLAWPLVLWRLLAIGQEERSTVAARG